MFGFKRYNYDSFTSDLLLKDVAKSGFGSGPEPGDSAPDFELRTLEGEKVRLGDYEGEKNLVLTFGSATCPFTAGSIRDMNELYGDYEDSENVDFLFVYVREAHPGEKLAAHTSMREKIAAARLFRDEEDVEIPIAVDDLEGRVHKKYGKLPNPTFIIDKSGRIAFRSMWTRPSVIEEAIEELLEAQEARDVEHAIVRDGEDRRMPMSYAMLHSHRALERGGEKSIQEFRSEMGRPGRIAHTASRVAGPLVMNPGRVMLSAGLVGLVIAGGLYAGMRLRRARLGRSRDPYHHYEPPKKTSPDDYAVGI